MKKQLIKITVAAAALLLPGLLKATPYASGLVNVGGTVSFYLNESGGNVTVTYEDGSTNAVFNGSNATSTNLTKGQYSFALGSHTGYAVSVYKTGNGTPSLISTDTYTNNVWPSPRGVAVNIYPQNGAYFGRIYADNSTAGGTAGTTYKGRGLYAFNADMTDALGIGTNAVGGANLFWTNASSSSPYHLRVAPDNSLIVGDYSTAHAGLWEFSPNLTSSNLVLAIVGETPAVAAGIHGDMQGTSLITGSTNTGDMVVWVADGGLPAPASATMGPNTSPGNYNCIYRYDVGSGPLPWNHPPNFAYSLGLPSIGELVVDLDLGKDGKIIGGFYRSNLSNPDVQILDPTGANLLWTSWADTGGASDPWSGLATVGSDVGGCYGGIRVSPDGRFLAAVDVDNGITIANLTNGIPDDASIYGIKNASNTGNARGMSWDAADNIYVISSGQGLLRSYSLGITTTCVTSNDITGTNGSFQLILPPVAASVVATTNLASQNYVNNSSNPGTPIPGVLTISLSTNTITTPVTVAYVLSGTAVLNTNYTIQTGTDANGVVITTNSVTFPAGTMPGGVNWSTQVKIVPTATPVSGPTYTVTLQVLGGSQSLAGSPGKDTVSIQNTGPQLLFLSAAAKGTNMNRNVSSDYAEFVITRWGDTNGPANSPGSITPMSYTVTNFTFGGTAVFPLDYTAGPQRLDPNFDGVPVLPTNGPGGVIINPGAVTVTAVIGNPVFHPNLYQTPTNLVITLSATNLVTGTNLTSFEGKSYSVVPGTVTLNELDNVVGKEVVLWSNPLTNSTETDWTVTYAATNQATSRVLPVVIPNYTNYESTTSVNSTNDFLAVFGWPVINDSIPPSPLMVANGWSNVLKVAVNDYNNNPSGVNLYPQGESFAGNYALRFSMYLSLDSQLVGNAYSGLYPFQFALFGVNHTGTNCNWRTASSIVANPAFAAPTNSDGVWFAIDAGAGSITPADFDVFTPPALPNAGVSGDYTSSAASQESGVFKSPPFSSALPGTSAGGSPVNQWVDVSVQITSQTNVSLLMNRQPVVNSFNLTNGSANYQSGDIMLGYLCPNYPSTYPNSFVYYSNVRVVELSPYIYAGATNQIVVAGASPSFVASAWLATAPLTNTWYSSPDGIALGAALKTDTAATTNLTSSLTLNSVQVGTNLLAVFSDAAGSVTSSVTTVEVIIPPASKTVYAGSNFVSFTVGASGPAAPTAYQWKTNGVNLANGSKYAGVTTATLTITNVQLADALTYSCTVTSGAGAVAPSTTLNVVAVPTSISGLTFATTNAVVAFSSGNVFDTTNSFTLLSSPNVQGPYTPVTGIITNGPSGTFLFKVPLTTNNTMFYQIKHK